MLAAIAAADRKMMVWGEVFAGGIGGLIARHLPGRTPPPLGMRAAINAWYISNNIPWLGRDAGYMARTGDAGAVLVADDSDVASIAVHITRMAVDGLLGREPFRLIL